MATATTMACRGKNKFVASVSFGEERLFDIRSKYDHTNKFSILLEDGSYLLMKNNFQEKWQHRIAKSKFTNERTAEPDFQDNITMIMLRKLF